MQNSKELLSDITKEVVENTFSNKIEVKIIDDIVCLSEKDKDILFGKENINERKVNVFVEKSKVLSVPFICGTDKTKVYITTRTKNFLGIEAPIIHLDEKKIIENEIRIEGDKSEIKLFGSVFRRGRFIVIPLDIANFIGVKEGDIVSVKVNSERGLVYNNVKIFIGGYKKFFCLDRDEALSADLNDGSIVEIIIKKDTKNNKDYKLKKEGIFIKIL